MCLRTETTKFTSACWDEIRRLKQELNTADAVIIGAGAGLSTSAGFTYAGNAFTNILGTLRPSTASTTCIPAASTRIIRWKNIGRTGAGTFISTGIWMRRSRFIRELYDLVKDKDYFVLTTNVDHCFQKAGFDKHRLFYTQGDYGLFQCSEPCHQGTYDNAAIIRKMVEAQGYVISENGGLSLPDGILPEMKIPSELVPHCPKCGKPMSMNLRSDDTFVEDEGWHRAAQRYSDFLRKHQNMRVLFLEAAVGFNTPGIIKYPFWRMTAQNRRAVYACVNLGEAWAPREIAERAICLDGDIGEVLKKLK